MSEKEKKIIEKLVEGLNKLPETKKERLLGYAEGVADMIEKSETQEHRTN